MTVGEWKKRLIKSIKEGNLSPLALDFVANCVLLEIQIGNVDETIEFEIDDAIKAID